MSIIQAIILGIVQGITEFLPVSSSGHLAIIQNIFHIQTDGGLFFDVMLHLDAHNGSQAFTDIFPRKGLCLFNQLI